MIDQTKQETYSSPLVNYTEPYNINGKDYTKFHTELNTELRVGDYVYILNGNYDSSNLINQNEYQRGTTGYKILYINKNAIVLDIEYRAETPYNDDDFEEYTKVYVVDTRRKFTYEHTDNGNGFEISSGKKYSNLSNNIFYYNILDGSGDDPLGGGPQAMGKFYKSEKDGIDLPYYPVDDLLYYPVDLDNNEIPLDPELYKNDRLYIMEDFEYDGNYYKKGDILKWVRNEKRWVVDITYLKPYISKSHFKDGSFIGDSILNDGIFGNRDSNARWTGDNTKWRNGILYNSIWENGIMESKSDILIDQSYYSLLDIGKVSELTDYSNNSSYGYNLAIGSRVEKGVINNGNFKECIIGTTGSNGNLLDSIYGGTSSHLYSGVAINRGNFINTEINSTQLNKSRIDSSSLNSSLITNESRIINSESHDSIIEDTTIENKGRVKIIGYDKWYDIRTRDDDSIDVVHIHKFFIDKEHFDEIEFGTSLIFNDIETNTGKYTDLMDDIYYVIGGEEDGYYKDVYVNLNEIESDRYSKKEFKLFLSKKLDTQNTKKSVINFNGATVSVAEVDNSKPQYSIDLSIIVDNIPDGSQPDIYLDSLRNDGILKFDIIDIGSATIQTKHINHSWIRSGDWLSGSMISPNQLSNLFGKNEKMEINTDGNLVIELNDSGSGYEYEFKSSDLLKVGDVVVVDNIWKLDNNALHHQQLGGNFKIESISGSEVILKPYHIIPPPVRGEVTQPISQYKFINTNRLDGKDNELRIRKGIFKNQTFANLEFNKLPTLSQNIDRVTTDLTIINSEITNDNRVIIKSGLFVHGQLSTGTTNNKFSGVLDSYKQVFDGFDINGGKIEKSAFIRGEFNNGTYINSRYGDNNDLIPINKNIITTDDPSILPIWISGTFNKGLFDKSVWLSGTFNNGSLLNSEFLNGEFNNGTFGDISSRSALNVFRKGVFNNGVFNNGIFGDNIKRVEEINPIYTERKYIPFDLEYTKDGTNIWHDGIFNNGIFTSIDGEVSLWRNGVFNNGQILDSVIWYDGVFNNGKFTSDYGRDVSYVIGEYDFDGVSTISNTNPNFPSSFLNKNNIATIRDKFEDNEFNNPGTIILDTDDMQLKYIYPSTHSTPTDTFSDDGSAHGYGEKILDSGSYSIQIKNIDDLSDDENRRNPLHDSNVIGANIFVQSSGERYVYDGDKYVPYDDFIDMDIATISFESITYSSVYAWRGGIFNDGEFGDPDNKGNANPSWEDGTFNGGKFYGKKWKGGTFVRGSFNGSGSKQRSIDINILHKGYNPQQLVEKYMTKISNVDIGTQDSEQIGKKNIITNWKWRGLWLGGQVRSNINELMISSARVDENIQMEYFKKDKFNRDRAISTDFNGVLWVSGSFNSPDANFNESVWLSGEFNNGKFNDSMFNPYVQRWTFETNDLSDMKFTFDLDTNSCVWNNGTFNSGVFYYSDWNNGTFENGTMVGAQFNKGMANYMSAYSTIWVDGRFRNGNWYGSNFTINNIYGNDSVSNPFEYLGSYFEDVEYAPFIKDILGNNANRLQDDRLHIWNVIGGETDHEIYDLENGGHGYGTDQYSEPNNSSTTSGHSDPSDNRTTIRFTLEEISNNADLAIGQHYLSLDVRSFRLMESIYDQKPRLYYNFSLTSSDQGRFTQGIYEIDFYTTIISNPNGTFVNRWAKFPNLDYMELIVTVDRYLNGIYQETTQVKHITSDRIDNQNYTLLVDENEECRMSVTLKGGREKEMSLQQSSQVTPDFQVAFPLSDDFKRTFTIKVTELKNDVRYTDENNTLGGHIKPDYSGDYLNSNIGVTSSSHSYIGSSGVTHSLTYETLYIKEIYTGGGLPYINGVYAQYGNGAFLGGIWENGVWNNGYRGTEYGTHIVDDVNTLPNGYTYDTFTYGSGETASVLTNSLYTDRTVFQRRTSPTMYFNRVQRSFKTSNNRWRFVLESAFDIQSISTFGYGRLKLGDRVSVGNIVAIDINGNRKLIKDLFTVVASLTTVEDRNRVTLEYKETFPIDDIQIDSDRHLIYVQKNVWLYGSFLNGYFEGVMNGGYIRGNRELTKIVDSHLIDIRFEGGRLEGRKYVIEHAFDNRSSRVRSMSPQFAQLYNNKYHSTVVQYMDFIDDVSHSTLEMRELENIKIRGENGEKEFTYKLKDDIVSDGVRYIYNSDIDVVYEPEYYSSIFNQSIFNDNLSKYNTNTFDQTNVAKRLIPSIDAVYMYNTPAGFITYDILSSTSRFNYSLSGKVFEEKAYTLNLGSKYKKYNPLTDMKLSEPTKKIIVDTGTASVSSNQVDTVPSTFNQIDSGSLGIRNRWLGSDGIRFTEPDTFNIHEDFMYVKWGLNINGTPSTPGSGMIVCDSDFVARDRYHIVEVDVEFPENRVTVNPNPDNLDEEIVFDIRYTYSSDNLPKLTIGQGYNELYELHGLTSSGRISPYDNDFIPYLDGRKFSEINGFTESNRITMKTYMYNNFGGYRDNVKIFEKGFDHVIDTSTVSVSSPIYYDIKHYEIDQIPFFRYQDYYDPDPITGTMSEQITEWNIPYDDGVNHANHDKIRSVDTRIKVPFYATSVPIQYDDDNFVLSENINFLGGTNIDNNFVISIELFNILNNKD